MGIVYPTKFGPVIAPLEDVTLRLTLMLGREYEAKHSRLFSAIVKKVGGRPNFLCAGANIGLRILPLMGHCRRIAAIEANPDAFRLLEANIRLNRADNVQAYNVAVWSKKGTLRFLQHLLCSVWSRVVARNYKPPGGLPRDLRSIEVKASKLDELLPGEKFELMLIDVEESESMALAGAKRIMKGVQVLQIEFSFRVGKAVIEALLAELKPNFRFLYSPTMEVSAENAEFEPLMWHMHGARIFDPGLIFSKINLDSVMPDYKPWSRDPRSASTRA